MLTLVPTPIGNLEDITIRALGAIRDASVILCEDTRVAKKLIELLISRQILKLPAQADAKSFIESKRFFSFHSHNQDDFIASLELDKKDIFKSNVLYLSDAGTPCISDPGAKLVNYAIKNNIDFDVLPGACALSVAYSASGVESTPFVFVGFLPHKKLERQEKLVQIAYLNMGGAYSAICYESPHRLLDALSDIEQFLPNVQLIVQKELTKAHQQRYYGLAREIKGMLLDSVIRGEWVIVLVFEQGHSVGQRVLDYQEALMLDIPPKIKAKILSKISGKSVKECYEELL